MNYLISWSPKFRGRITGMLGLLVLICGSYTHTINSQLIHLENPNQTIEKLIQSEELYRIGFMSGLLMETIFIFYAFLLYSLLKPINAKWALALLILALIPAPIFYTNQLHHFAAFLSAQEHLVKQMNFYLTLHKHGGFIISIFFGLWLFPLGYLVYRSGFLPNFLGILLMIGSLGYLINCIQGFLFPGTEATLWTNPALVVTHISEILLMGWLLIVGVREKQKN